MLQIVGKTESTETINIQVLINTHFIHCKNYKCNNI